MLSEAEYLIAGFFAVAQNDKGAFSMNESKAMKELHDIMGRFYEEEKNLTSDQKVRKIREESEGFLRERGIKLKRMKSKKLIKFAQN